MGKTHQYQHIDIDQFTEKDIKGFADVIKKADILLYIKKNKLFDYFKLHSYPR